jgi:hypothetical protein
MFNIKFTPEAFFILPTAIILDSIGIILVCFLLDDFTITDAIGYLVFYPWLLLKRKKIPDRREKAKGWMDKFKNFCKGKTSKFIVPFLEAVPYLGCLPFWTILAISNLEEE